MEKEQVIQELSKYGVVEAFNDNHSLVCLITGKDLTKSKTMYKITKIVGDYAGDRFPFMQCMVNKEDFILIVLSPKKAIL